jgi:hypothetical protein
MSLTKRFQKIEPGLGAIHTSAKITHLDAVIVGAKPPCHLADYAKLAVTWLSLDFYCEMGMEIWLSLDFYCDLDIDKFKILP